MVIYYALTINYISLNGNKDRGVKRVYNIGRN